jgi:hypothetical protein
VHLEVKPVGKDLASKYTCSIGLLAEGARTFVGRKRRVSQNWENRPV